MPAVPSFATKCLQCGSKFSKQHIYYLDSKQETIETLNQNFELYERQARKQKNTKQKKSQNKLF
jgi:hypothetical protein